MPDDTTATAVLIHAEWAGFLALLDDALSGGRHDGPPGQQPDGARTVWERPTRLAGWTVEDLVRHVHWGTTLETAGLRLATSGGAGVAQGRELTVERDAIRPALREALDGLTAALADVTSGTDAGTGPGPAAGTGHGTVTVPMPYGDVPLDLALGVFLMEAAVHRSDLADALTGDGTLTAAALPACAAVLQVFWPALAGSARTVPPDGTAIRLDGTSLTVEAEWDGATWGAVTSEPAVVLSGRDEPLLLFALGRLPLDRAGLTVTGDHDLAVRFKDVVPGP